MIVITMKSWNKEREKDKLVQQRIHNTSCQFTTRQFGRAKSHARDATLKTWEATFVPATLFLFLEFNKASKTVSTSANEVCTAQHLSWLENRHHTKKNLSGCQCQMSMFKCPLWCTSSSAGLLSSLGSSPLLGTAEEMDGTQQSTRVCEKKSWKKTGGESD